MCNHHCDTTHAWCHLHTHTWMAKWCGVANVLRLLCASTLAWSLHFATPFVCVTSSAKCVSPSIPSPLCFSITHPFWCVWHCQVAFTLSLWVLMHWCWHQCPSYGAHHASHPPLPVCVVMAFLHCPGPVNHLPPFLCVFWCVPQATASICTDRGGYALWCCLPQKSAMRDTMKRHTLAHFAFFRFLSSPFLWSVWR